MSVCSYDSLKDFAVCTSKLSGEWQQTESKNIWNFYYALGSSYMNLIKFSWSYPIIRYSFPDENSFQVEVKSQTGWSWLPGNCFVQTYELNEENEHELTDGDGGTVTSVTTMYDDVIRTVENGRACGTIVKERKLASDNDDVMIWTQRIVETDLTCERRFKRVKLAPIMY